MIRINEKPRKEIRFEELWHGDTFKYQDDYYIKCDEIDDGVINNVVNLSTGIHAHIADTTIVYSVNLECEVE